MGDVLFGEDPVQLKRPREKILLPRALSAAEDDPAAAVELHPRVIRGHVRQKVDRRVGVDGLVHVVPEEILRVEKAAQADHGVEEIGPAEEEISRVNAAHAAPADERSLPFHGESGQKLIRHIPEPPLLKRDPLPGISVRRGPGLPVDAVRADKPDLSGLDPRRNALRHAEITEIVKPPVLRRERDAEPLRFPLS